MPRVAAETLLTRSRKSHHRHAPSSVASSSVAPPTAVPALAAAAAAAATTPRDAARSFVSDSNPLVLLGAIALIVMLVCALSLLWRAWGQNEALKEQNTQLQGHIQSRHALDALTSCQHHRQPSVAEQDEEPDWDTYANPFAPDPEDDDVQDDQQQDEASQEQPQDAQPQAAEDDIIARASAAAAAAVAAVKAATTSGAAEATPTGAAVVDATASAPPPSPIAAVDFYRAAQPLDIDFLTTQGTTQGTTQCGLEDVVMPVPDEIVPEAVLDAAAAAADVTAPRAKGRRAKRSKAAAVNE